MTKPFWKLSIQIYTYWKHADESGYVQHELYFQDKAKAEALQEKLRNHPVEIDRKDNYVPAVCGHYNPMTLEPLIFSD